jgi:hypothetical protein
MASFRPRATTRLPPGSRRAGFSPVVDVSKLTFVDASADGDHRPRPGFPVAGPSGGGRRQAAKVGTDLARDFRRVRCLTS